jgi:group I intron endonuclease
MTIGIYAIIFEGSDKFYIGKSDNFDRRKKEHISSFIKGHYNYKLKEAYNLYGKPNFILIEECSIEELNSKEIFWIQEFNSRVSGLNITKGGDGGGISFDHPKAVYSEKQIIKAFKYLYSSNNSYNTIYKLTGVKVSTITAIASGRLHNWLSERFPKEYTVMLNSKENRISRRMF